MKTIGLTDNDLDFSVIEGHDEVKQCLEIELGSKLGEWFFDSSYGRSGDVFADKPTTEDIQLEIGRVIANESRVRLVSEINVTVEKAARHAVVTFTVEEVATNELIGMEVNI